MPRSTILPRSITRTASDAARVAAATGMMLTHVTGLEPDGEPRATLAGIAPGSLLGSRFEILSALGSGGMGVVYKARDRELDDLVALKMLKRDVAGDVALVSRLKTELKLARTITHPNVLRTFDFGEIDGHPFISMEYVRGVTLRSLLEESGRLPYAAALRLARQLLSGLSAGHALEILHRDIKPENVILDSGGSLKLMDFGLARPVTRLEAGETKEGWIVGTPHYLSPEQIEAREPDKRADVYACGVVLYELFTGQLPFTADSPMEILMKHLHLGHRYLHVPFNRPLTNSRHTHWHPPCSRARRASFRRAYIAEDGPRSIRDCAEEELDNAFSWAPTHLLAKGESHETDFLSHRVNSRIFAVYSLFPGYVSARVSELRPTRRYLLHVI